MLEDGVDVGGSAGRAEARIDTATAFWMATLGGADLLGIPAGLLAPGRVFDAVVVDTGRLGIDDDLDWERRFEKIVRGLRPGDINRVFVSGREVYAPGYST